MLRLAIVASHPIQYQAPWFRELAARVELEVFFCHKQDASGQADAGYGKTFEWDVPLLDGYSSQFLVNVSRQPGVYTFDGCDTPEIAERLAAGRFDACIVSGWYLKSYLQAIAACLRLRIPVLLRSDSQRPYDRSLFTRAIKYPAYRALLTIVAGHLYPGQANRRYLEHYGVPPDRLWFVPHCVDDRSFRQRADDAASNGRAAAWRDAFSVGADGAIALFVGRLVEEKRPVDFIRAVAAARRTMRVTGVMAGAGPLADALRQESDATGAEIRFAGFVNQSQLPALYATTDVVVLPARETWGLVANEALACGASLVVSDQTGCAPDLIDGLTGRVFPCGNVDHMARTIVDVLQERKRAPRAVLEAIRAMSDRYGAKAAAEATVAAVTVAAGRTPARRRTVLQSVQP